MLAQPAQAEWYFFKQTAQDSAETAVTIAQPTHAQRYFGRLDTKTDVDYFTFKVQKDMEVSLLLEIPTGDPDFHPTMTLFGPGLPKPTEDPSITIGESNGAVVAHEADKDRDSVTDAFLLTSFFEGPQIKTTAPKDATYAIAIRSPDGSHGRYVLNVGTEDTWEWREVFPRLWGIVRAILRIY